MVKKEVNIIPSGGLVVKSMRIAFIIIGVILAMSNVLMLFTCQLVWLKYITGIALFANFFFLVFAVRMTFEKKKSVTGLRLWSVYVIIFALLLMSTIPTIFSLLCGYNYTLLENLRLNTLLDFNKLILPLMLILFLSIAYWLPMRAIHNMQIKESKYIELRKMFYNDK